MKSWNLTGTWILGVLLLTFLFSSCQKDEELMIVSQEELEMRAKGCTQTSTKTTVKVSINEDAESMDVWNALHTEYRRVMNRTKDKVLYNILQDLWQELIDDRTDMNLAACNHIATCICEEDVYGFTMPFIRYAVTKNQLYIAVVNIELVEENAPAIAEKHEDFHTYVANEIVKKCAEQAACETGLTCTESGDAAVNTLQGLNDEAQALYDLLTGNGMTGDQRAAAQEAVNTVASNYLGS